MTVVVRALVFPIRLYQRLVSPLLGARCRFYPSCSEYAAQAMLKHGAPRGAYLGVRRLLRCHPWNPGGFDDVPETFTWRRTKAQEAA
jgi:putative membrane protein insertion efficiency factor